MLDRAARIVITGLLLGGLAAVVSPATAQGRCSVRGGPGGDVLTGTEGRDRICGRAGDDVVHALGGSDLVIGAKGNDTIEGGRGNDALWGGAGDDSLDGNGGVDVVRGGPGDDTIAVADIGRSDRAIGGRGTDTCLVDASDTVRGCETVQVVP
jgi:Ca2+-binding RTX toxin-like protein